MKLVYDFSVYLCLLRLHKAKHPQDTHLKRYRASYSSLALVGRVQSIDYCKPSSPIHLKDYIVV
jgi:hypothetical protein